MLSSSPFRSPRFLHFIPFHQLPTLVPHTSCPPQFLPFDLPTFKEIKLPNLHQYDLLLSTDNGENTDLYLSFLKTNVVLHRPAEGLYRMQQDSEGSKPFPGGIQASPATRGT